MKSKSIPAIVMIVVSLDVLGSMAFAAQNEYTVTMPGGLAFSEFRGYEDWQVVAVSETDELLKAMDGHVVGKSAWFGRFHTPAP